jgi:outer membrane protein TolC
MQGPEWSAGIQFSKPWNRDNLEAQKRAAKHERTQAMIKSGDMRIRIALEVDTVMSRLQADQQRLTATRKSREAAAQSADAGLKRLNEGVATSFEVLQLQREFSQARSREIAALTDLNKNIVDLQMATGTLLDEQGVNLVPDFSSASEVGGPEPVVNIPASEKSVSRASRVRKPGARKLP